MYRLGLIAFIVFFISCNSQNTNRNLVASGSADSINGPIMYFYKDTLNFGTITEGDEIKSVFNLKNIGKSDLIINSVTAGCGCTSTNWETKPIAPGKESEIKIIFNSSRKAGRQMKRVTVSSNAYKGEKVLVFTCTVVSPNKSSK
jgi:hypothetical protein